jgi:hypothetical protein
MKAKAKNRTARAVFRIWLAPPREFDFCWIVVGKAPAAKNCPLGREHLDSSNDGRPVASASGRLIDFCFWRGLK